MWGKEPRVTQFPSGRQGCNSSPNQQTPHPCSPSSRPPTPRSSFRECICSTASDAPGNPDLKLGSSRLQKSEGRGASAGSSVTQSTSVPVPVPAGNQSQKRVPSSPITRNSGNTQKTLFFATKTLGWHAAVSSASHQGWQQGWLGWPLLTHRPEPLPAFQASISSTDQAVSPCPWRPLVLDTDPKPPRPGRTASSRTKGDGGKSLSPDSGCCQLPPQEDIQVLPYAGDFTR